MPKLQQRSFSITIFVPDGDPDSLRLVEKSNWTGIGVVFNRTNYKQVVIQEEFNKTGVYVLVGSSEGSGLPTIYIGEGDPVKDRLVIANHGSFLPGDVESVIRRDAPMSIYRNGLLAQAMVNLGMIDTIGSGIKRIFVTQKKRSFPMPDFDLSNPNEVKVVLSNKVLDERYTRMLLARADLDLWDVIALDKVQKGKPLSDDEFKSVKSKQLIEGRRPNLFVSAEVAVATDDKESYIRNRAFDKEYYKDLVLAYVGEFGEATRSQIDRLLKDKLSDVLDDKQKKKSVTNLLQEMKGEGTIVPDGTTRWAKWRMSKPSENAEN